MPRSELRPDGSHPEPTVALEQHILAGFPPDLALDLVLNELVVRAAEATHATAAALALMRGDEMVCRAATGHLAPDLGVPLNTRDGLSGACLQTRQPQLSVDTEYDPRIDPVVSRRLGIRSILIVPVFDSSEKNAQFQGILEVFSSSPAAFSHNDQQILEDFASECARIRKAATEIIQRKPLAILPAEVASPKFVLPGPPLRSSYEHWALALGALTILAAVAISFMIGSRIGWLRQAPSAASVQAAQPVSAEVAAASSCVGISGPGCPPDQNAKSSNATHRSRSASSEKTAAKSDPPTDELVIYEKGKVIFRMKPAPPRLDAPDHRQSKGDAPSIPTNTIVEASSTTKIAKPQIVWLSPTQADAYLLSRTEPYYPPDALAAHRAGDVVLEVQVAEDGSVSKVRPISGDPVLAKAAVEAIRNWRYQPYRQHGRAKQFQTDVTLGFSLPN